MTPGQRDGEKGGSGKTDGLGAGTTMLGRPRSTMDEDKYANSHSFQINSWSLPSKKYEEVRHLHATWSSSWCAQPVQFGPDHAVGKLCDQSPLVGTRGYGPTTNRVATPR